MAEINEDAKNSLLSSKIVAELAAAALALA